MIDFTPFPKLGRLNRTMTITEKLDGTNAAIRVVPLTAYPMNVDQASARAGDFLLYAQSRNRIITPGKATDNMGSPSGSRTTPRNWWASVRASTLASGGGVASSGPTG